MTTTRAGSGASDVYGGNRSETGWRRGAGKKRPKRITPTREKRSRRIKTVLGIAFPCRPRAQERTASRQVLQQVGGTCAVFMYPLDPIARKEYGSQSLPTSRLPQLRPNN